MVKNATCEDTVIQELTDKVYISDEYCQMETMYFDNTTTMRHDDKTRQYNRGIFSITLRFPILLKQGKLIILWCVVTVLHWKEATYIFKMEVVLKYEDYDQKFYSYS